MHEAGGYDEALTVLENAASTIQLLFTDVQMPPSDMSGFDLAKMCAQHWPHINILVASGMIEPQEKDLPNGAVFVRKPFSAEVVYERLQAILPYRAKPEPLKRRSA